MSPLETFWWGFAGSWAVEVVTLNQAFYELPNPFPERYKHLVFWVVRFFLAVAGGYLAVAHGIDKPILALNIGAATPALILTLAQGWRPPPTPSNGE